MKSEDEIRAQREWFYNRALEFETLYENSEKNENYLHTAEAFSVVVGTLDWVLDDAETV